MEKIEKIFYLDRLLANSKYSVPLPKILNELDCSEATFHRIRSFMITRFNAPIEFNRRTKGYYYKTIDGKPFQLPGFWLFKEEIEALLCLDHSIDELHEGYFHELLDPVRKRFEPILRVHKTDFKTFRERIKILSMASRACNREVFKTIASAVIGSRRLTICHRALVKDESQQRTISPQTLVRYRDNWYVDAFCHLRNELRTFALDRIESAEITRGKFLKISKEKMIPFYAQSYGIFNGPADKKAVIEFSGIAAREVSRETWHPQQEGQWIAADKHRLTIPYGHGHELIMDVLRWGDEAEIIEPQELRNSVKATIIGMQKKYEK